MAALSHSPGEMLPYLIGNQELRIFGPAVKTLCQLDLVFAKRLPVRAAGVLHVRSTIGDKAVDHDERRPIDGVMKDIQRALQHIEIVGIADTRYVPACTDDPGCPIFAECHLGMAFNRDFVPSVKPSAI